MLVKEKHVFMKEEQIDNKGNTLKKSDLSRLLETTEANNVDFNYVTEKLKTIIKKGDNGEPFADDEIDFVNKTYNNNYLYMLSPVEKGKDDNWIIGIIYAIVAIGIILRCIITEKSGYGLYISGTFNYLAILATCLMMCSHITSKTSSWIEASGIFEVDKEKMRSRFKKGEKSRHFVLFVCFVLLAAVNLFILQSHQNIAGKFVDAQGMIAFGLAVSNDHVEALLIQNREKKLSGVQK